MTVGSADKNRSMGLLLIWPISVNVLVEEILAFKRVYQNVVISKIQM